MWKVLHVCACGVGEVVTSWSMQIQGGLHWVGQAFLATPMKLTLVR